MNDHLKTYVIERPMPGAGAKTQAQLRAVCAKSNAVLGELGPNVQWVHSYVTQDKIYCVYRATGPELIREHARCGGFPAEAINLVKRIVDPTTAGESLP